MIDAPQQIAEEMVMVAETHDRDLLRRWMMRPAFIRKMGGETIPSEVLETAFGEIANGNNRFFSVHVRGEEKGCIILKRSGKAWELHLCLATWLTHSRIALRKALSRIASEAIIMARYPQTRRAIDRLLDDVGFGPCTNDGTWTVRTITI